MYPVRTSVYSLIRNFLKRMKQPSVYTLILLIGFLILFELYSHIHKSVDKTTGASDVHKHDILSSNVVRDARPDNTETLIKDSQPIDHKAGVGGKHATTNETVREEKTTPKPSKLITVAFIGRLGNLMFEYASLLGIAQRNCLIPVIPESFDLLKYFDIRTETHPNYRKFGRQYQEKKGCTFEPEVMNLGSSGDMKLNGYFQSWKYFDFVEKDIRANFRWKEHIWAEAVRQMNEIVKSSRPSKHFIGVHVRRGDMVHSAHMTSYGYISAGKDYLEKAMNHFRSKFSDAIFIVVSDEIDWCSKNIPGDDVRLVRKKNVAAVDMAILTMCNHTVMTTGSYGWWAAWLTGGDVVYYSGYPRPNSTLFSLVKPEDYRPPSWIGM